MNQNQRLPEAMPALLLEWYDQNARDLPWRHRPTPYQVWVSEIMLQQTRVEAVKEYYTRFLSALPALADLAAAPEEQLLKLWEGLGYYSRVRNLQKAAQMVMEEYGGEVPASRAELRKLPGIGDYTSGSIASIAFQLREPAVDGNVLRVLARLLADREDIAKPQAKQTAEELLRPLIPARAGDFNQSVMELGATVCLPNGSPLCSQCPLQNCCLGYQTGIQEELPVKSKKPSRKIEEKTVFLLVYKGKVALQKRPDKGLLAGMWEFPSAPGTLSRKQAEEWLSSRGIILKKLSALKPARHIFTHIQWEMSGFYGMIETAPQQEELIWCSKNQLQEEYALPSAFDPFVRFFFALEDFL